MIHLSNLLQPKKLARYAICGRVVESWTECMIHVYHFRNLDSANQCEKCVQALPKYEKCMEEWLRR